MIKNAIALIAIAGSTTITNNSWKIAPAPNTKIADDRKTVPDIRVPIAVRTTPTATLFANLLNNKTSPKKTKAVTALSMIFGTNPPGKVENNPDITPVEIPNKKYSSH